MKKILYLTLLLVAGTACDLASSVGGGGPGLIEHESDALVQLHISDPVRLLGELRLMDRYLSDPDLQGDTTGFAKVRRNLLEGDADTYLYKSVGTIETGGQSLRTSGVVWSVKPEQGWADLYDSLPGRGMMTVTCQQDSLWTAVEGDVRTVMSALSDSLFVVSVAGKEKTHDGYGCDMKTVGEFRVKTGPNRSDRKYGRFYHTVSRDGKVMDACESIWEDKNVTHKVSR